MKEYLFKNFCFKKIYTKNFLKILYIIEKFYCEILMKRVFLLVLDLLGIGSTEDSYKFNNQGVNTLRLYFRILL